MSGVTITLLFLAAVFVQIQGSENLARNKPATQSISWANRPASMAVNGVYNDLNDFSRTWPLSNQWWAVDLRSTYHLSRVELYNRQGTREGKMIGENLAKVSIYTTTTESPPNIVISPDAWTLRHYQEEAYGAVGIILLNRRIPARHVLVHCGADEGLSLQEVMVYEERIFAITNTVSQNGESSDHPASSAVDGDLATYSSTTGSAPYWWKAYFSTVVLFKKANVFVTNDSCASQPCGEVSYLTTQDNDAKEPTGSKWDLCNTHVRNNSTQYEVTCNNSYTITKQFGLSSVGESVTLREIQIFEYVLPQLNKNVDGRTESSNATSVTVSFLQWNEEMIGELPPTVHRIQIDGAVRFLSYTNRTKRVTSTFNNLTINTKYTVEVTCMVESYDYPGFKQTFSTWTACNGSQNLSYLLKSFRSLNRRAVVSIHLNELNPYCLNITRYTIQMKYGNGSIVDQQNITSHGEVNITDLYGFTFYTVAVLAFNYDDLKSSSSRNITTPETSPPDSPASLQLSSHESCVTLSVTPPITANGIVTHYWLNCTIAEVVSGQKVIPSELRGITNTVMCGFPSDTNITCSAQANNSVGLGEPIFNYIISQLKAPPGTPASLQLSFNKNCVTLSITPPIITNGIITHYWLNCTSAEVVSGHRVIPSELGGITNTIMCGFPSDTNITCSAQANNSVGLSEPIFNYTISQLEVCSKVSTTEGASGCKVENNVKCIITSVGTGLAGLLIGSLSTAGILIKLRQLKVKRKRKFPIKKCADEPTNDNDLGEYDVVDKPGCSTDETTFTDNVTDKHVYADWR